MEDDSIQVETNETDEKSPDEELLEQARKHFKMAAEAENDFRVEAIDDLQFLAGDQWDPEILRQREDDGRPCLKINKLPGHVRQVENDNRQNLPSIKIRPGDAQANIDTAAVWQGLVRAIERNSNADVAYDRAFSGAIRARRGVFRILTDWESPTSFHQVIKFGSFRNPLMVHLDPAMKEPDGSDMEFGFVSEFLPEEEFKAKYPKAEKSNAEEFKSLGDDSPHWVNDERMIRVSEYFYREWKEDTLLLFSDNSTGLESDLRKMEKEQPEAHKAMIAQRGLPVNKRETRVPSVKWCLLTGTEVLEKRDWPGYWIPLIPVLGEELDVNGKLLYKGLISDAKDSQRLLNYMKSSEVETIALAPKAPWIGYEGQFKGHEHKWQTANKKLWPYLEVKPISIGGQPAGFPQRQQFEPAIQAVTVAAREANDDLKASTGINDASMGIRTNETSGVGIRDRAKQAQVSNFHFTDNLTRSIRHAGRVILDLIPYVYDTERTIQIIGEDDTEKSVLINKMLEDGKGHFVDKGKYEVAVDTGPSFMTKRQEASEMMIDLATKVPQLMQAAADLLVGNMDIPQAKEIADRLKKMLPPGVATDEKAQGQPLPPAIAAELQKNSQMVEQLSKAVHALHDERDKKLLELQSKERIAMEQIKSQLEIAMLQAQSKEGIALLEAQMSEIQHRLDTLNSTGPLSLSPAPQEPDQDDFQAAGAQGAGQPEQPTGGSSPGQSMEQP